MRDFSILRFSYPSLKPIPCGYQGTSVQVPQNLDHSEGARATLGDALSAATADSKARHHPGRKKPNVISHRSLPMKGPRAEVATAGLIFTPPAAGRLRVQGQHVCAGDLLT